jgi:hypothetical protein
MPRTILGVIQRLIDEGVGVAGQTILAGNDPGNVPPDDVDAHIVIHEYGGRTPEGTHNEGFLATRRPSFQIVAKADRYPDAANLAETAFAKCSLVNTAVVVPGSGSVFFITMYPLQDPFELPADAVTGKSRVAFNIHTHVR